MPDPKGDRRIEYNAWETEDFGDGTGFSSEPGKKGFLDVFGQHKALPSSEKRSSGAPEPLSSLNPQTL